MNDVRLTFLGDLRVDDAPIANLHSRLTEVRSALSETDIVIANLEGPIGSAGNPRLGRGALLYNSEQIIELCRTWTFPVFSLANNHIMDFGPEGLARTIAVLDANNIPHVGAGMTEDAAMKPLIVTINGLRLGFLAFTTDERHVGSVCAASNQPGCANLFHPRTLPIIRSLAREVQRVCVIVHWGREFHAYPSPEQVCWVKQLADAGASIIVGHHPHVVQGIQATPNTLAAYSLGNFLFPPFEQTNGRTTVQAAAEREFLILCVRLSAERLIWSAIPGVRTKREELKRFWGRRLAKHESRLRKLSGPLVQESYASYYGLYAARQARQLARTDLWKSLRKLRWRDLRSIKPEDIHRLWERLRFQGRRANLT